MINKFFSNFRVIFRHFLCIYYGMKTIDETLLIPVLEEGGKLYHYTSAAGLQGICGGEFWVIERSFLNDIMEFQVATQIFCEVLDKHMANKVCAEKLKKKVCDEIDRLNRPGMLGEEVAYSGDYGAAELSVRCSEPRNNQSPGTL